MWRVMFAELSSQPLKVYGVNSVGLKSNFGSKKPFSLTDTLSVQSLMHPLKQCVNTFKNKVSLSIHPTDAAPRRSMGFLDRFDKTLYQAKSDGRNKSVIFTSTTETIARYTFNNNNLPNKKSSVVLSKTQFQTST
jgi:hypothetical protein